VKPKLLVVELWGLGDLVIATPFIRAAREKYDVTLLAKPYAEDLQRRLWGDVQVIPFIAPWTAFKHKYRLWSWPWRQMARLRRQLETRHFEFGLSARWDPRDHLLLRTLGVRSRLGFPRLGSQAALTQPLRRPEPQAHRYEYWRVLGQALGIEVIPREQLHLPHSHPDAPVLIHTGAGQNVRVWPLERYREVVRRLRASGLAVQVACDPDQQEWWRAAGERDLTIPRSVGELLALIDRSCAFIGNDSGPGHLAAFCGVPTFTLFGPQLPEWFAPLHPAGETMEGKACPYKPCSDYCRFASPCCMNNQELEEVWDRVQAFLSRLKQLAQPTPG
jgi:heptosyltransferase-2